MSAGRDLVAPAGDEASPQRERPSFSVVVAAYQAASTIGAAVESALAQTYPPVEVIVCDDGSTDDLPGALLPFRGRIECIRQDNRGEAAAKNAAARRASGDFVSILDADDVYLPGRLEALADAAARRPDLDMLTTDAFLEVGGLAVRRCYNASWSFEVADQRGEILRRNFVFGLAAVRRSTLLAAGGFDEELRHATDWDCWLRLIVSGSRIGLVPVPLARYRIGPDSLSANRPELLRGRARVLDKAVANPALTDAERADVRRSARRAHTVASAAAMYDALVSEAPHARRDALAVAVARSPLRVRLIAAAGGIAPRLVGRFLAERRRRHGRSGQAGIRHAGGAEASPPTSPEAPRR
jgi:GT2 family glycosyltransferase